MDALHDVRRVVHDLLRHAAHVDAGAAERALLADGDLGACGARGYRGDGVVSSVWTLRSAPCVAARRAEAMPPEPAPITK